MLKSTIFLSLLAASQGFSLSPTTQRSSTALAISTQATADEIESRRQFFSQGSAGVLAVMGLMGVSPEQALASGGATAGKYTTIPIAKRYVPELHVIASILQKILYYGRSCTRR